MAKLGVSYEMDIESTDRQFGGGGLLPHMYARLWAETIETKETNDGKGYYAAITFEVQEPEEFKGRKLWENWTYAHSDGKTNKGYAYGKHKLDSLGRAVDVIIDSDTDTDDLILKTFVAEVDINQGGIKNQATGERYKDKNQIKRFFFEDERAVKAGESVPELGIIEDAPKAANDNKPAPAPAAAPAKAAAGGGKRPW